MLHVISNPNAVTVDVTLGRNIASARRVSTKSRQGLYDTLAAFAGMALVLASWYGLNLALQIMAIKDVSSFIAD